METRAQICKHLMPGKQRLTRQRLLILEELRSVTSHPSAQQVYEMVRPKLPAVSFGTIYRNLKFLQNLGLLQELNYGKRCSRFDGNPQPHYHILCGECKRVDDVPMEAWKELDSKVEDLTQYKIKTHRVEFYGTCPRCGTRKGGKRRSGKPRSETSDPQRKS